ncbi:GNAT family N-acetyltransferase [Pseudaestuariivita rosea]|uniref:GNAT family N-acetyltransferase n=1 Tax=Pseudaestuariivita rosea TaxID=2763263 RepID=UPI001ABA3C36|nr:GNAT family N-acetyltransferase [Pseudaestuariivita rosea]
MAIIQHPRAFEVENGFRSEHRQQIAEGYWRAFARKLRYPLGPEAKAVPFVKSVLDPTYAISAVSKDGSFLGAAGFKTPNGAFIVGRFDDLALVYGYFGAVLRGLTLQVLERECADGTLLMDGIFVKPEARGCGVGQALLQAIEARASSMGLHRVRLDVIDTNPRARALYERQGFTETSVTNMGPLRAIFGFSESTEMTKEIGGKPA